MNVPASPMRFHTRRSPELHLPLVFGHFVPWFTRRGDDFPLAAEKLKAIPDPPRMEDERHWQDARAGYRRTHLHLPAWGTYDSRDPAVIHRQIEVALEFGVDGFILNWYGTNSVENVITLHWLEGLHAWNEAHPHQPFHYFLSIDSQCQWPTEGKTPRTMEEDFLYIREHLVTDAYLLRDGRPVFCFFPYEQNAPAWRRALDGVFGEEGADLVWMNGPSGVEQGLFPWVRPDNDAVDHGGRYTWFDPDNDGCAWLQSFYANACASGVDYIMGGVWPGFDDQLVSWAWQPDRDKADVRPRVMCRETTRGNTLERTWDVYLEYLRTSNADCPAPLVQVVTWNDYAEASTVEPTRDYGTGPLETCRRKKEEARRIWKTMNDEQ